MTEILCFAAGALVAAGWVAYRSYRHARDASQDRSTAVRSALRAVVNGAGGPGPLTR